MPVARSIRFAAALATTLTVAAPLALAPLSAAAQTASAPGIKAEAAWARPTSSGQKVAGAYVKLTSPAAATLVGAASPVATSVEIHEMKMEGDVMRMRAIDKLPLPAGQTVELKPGGLHLMLMGLKQQLKTGDRIPLTLTVQGAQGQPATVAVEATVAEAGAKTAPDAAHDHGGHDHSGHKH